MSTVYYRNVGLPVLPSGYPNDEYSCASIVHSTSGDYTHAILCLTSAPLSWRNFASQDGGSSSGAGLVNATGSTVSVRSYQWSTNFSGMYWEYLSTYTLSTSYGYSGDTVSGCTWANYDVYWTADDDGSGGQYTTTDKLYLSCSEPAESMPVAPVITADLPSSISFEVGNAKPLTIEASCNDDGTLSYKWYKKGAYFFSSIQGETSASYTPDDTTVGDTLYKCVVTNTDEPSQCYKTTTSTICTVSITEQTNTNTATPSVAMSGFLLGRRIASLCKPDTIDIYTLYASFDPLTAESVLGSSGTTGGEREFFIENNLKIEYSGGYLTIAEKIAHVSVTYPAGWTCTCNGEAAPNTSGSYTFEVVLKNTYCTVSCTDGTNSMSKRTGTLEDGDTTTVVFSPVSGTVNVTYPEGWSCACGDRTAPDTSGSWSFNVIFDADGSWAGTIRAVSGDKTLSARADLKQAGDVVNIVLAENTGG